MTPLIAPAQLAALFGPGIWRTHYRRDGRPKRPLTPELAAAARTDGLRTYRCPLCGATHAATAQATSTDQEVRR